MRWLVVETREDFGRLPSPLAVGDEVDLGEALLGGFQVVQAKGHRIEFDWHGSRVMVEAQPVVERDADPEFVTSHAQVAWLVDVFEDEADLTDPAAIAEAGYVKITGHQMKPVLALALHGENGERRLLDDVDLEEGED